MNATASPIEPSVAHLKNAYSGRTFPEFDLKRLLHTVFHPKGGERVAILIDLQDTANMKDYAFLADRTLFIQHHAYHRFFNALRAGVMKELAFASVDLYAYTVTGGSNLDLPAECVDAQGNTLSLESDICAKHDLILCISTFSATAPLTAFAKQYGFRGATMHGMNSTILATGLAVDYDEVSKQAEKLRLGMTKADAVEIDFSVAGHSATLRLDLGQQEAQKSHGLCRGGPDVANLPAGEVYFIPTNAHGEFPMRYSDGTLGMLTVADCAIRSARLISGNQGTIDDHNARLLADPMIGKLGELGFGTQELPPCGKDIQDEKILGTLHVATGRSDHLGGSITPDLFVKRSNATHDDILFSSTKTPEIDVPEARLFRDGRCHVVIERYGPSAYLKSLLAS
jgi:hypothetical protein